MHDHLILLVVGVPLLLAICTFCTLAALRAAALEDASLDRLRHEGLGEPLSVPAPEWCNAPHTTGPYYDELAAEAGRAARDLDVEWWLENGGTTA